MKRNAFAVGGVLTAAVAFLAFGLVHAPTSAGGIPEPDVSAARQLAPAPRRAPSSPSEADWPTVPDPQEPDGAVGDPSSVPEPNPSPGGDLTSPLAEDPAKGGDPGDTPPGADTPAGTPSPSATPGAGHSDPAAPGGATRPTTHRKAGRGAGRRHGRHGRHGGPGPVGRLLPRYALRGGPGSLSLVSVSTGRGCSIAQAGSGGRAVVRESRSLHHGSRDRGVFTCEARSQSPDS